MSNTVWETIEVKGTELLKKIQELVAEGNVRQVRVRQDGRVLAQFPLTAGVVGLLMAPALAAIGAIAALVSDCTIDVERARPADAPDAQAFADAAARPATNL